MIDINYLVELEGIYQVILVLFISMVNLIEKSAGSMSLRLAKEYPDSIAHR